MESQSSQVKSIKVCILYAIEEENIVKFDKIREFVQDACDELKIFSNAGDPNHRFFDVRARREALSFEKGGKRSSQYSGRLM